MTDADLPFPVPTLAPHEEQRFQTLEDTVREGLKDFRRAGQALSEIRDNELFRATHESFGAYLADRWGFTGAQAERLIGANEVAKVLEPLGIEPVGERQARAYGAATRVLTELEPERQAVVSRLIRAAAPATTEGDDLPWHAPEPAELRIMTGVVKKMNEDTTVYHPESGAEVALGTLSRPQQFEVIQTHVQQKTQAYHEKQAAKAEAEPKVNWADWCIEYAGQLRGGQRLELVIGPGGEAQARIMDHDTGEVLVEGQPAPHLRRAVTNLVKLVK